MRLGDVPLCPASSTASARRDGAGAASAHRIGTERSRTVDVGHRAAAFCAILRSIAFPRIVLGAADRPLGGRVAPQFRSAAATPRAALPAR
jgi:hypothetical protein